MLLPEHDRKTFCFFIALRARIRGRRPLKPLLPFEPKGSEKHNAEIAPNQSEIICPELSAGSLQPAAEFAPHGYARAVLFQHIIESHYPLAWAF